MKKAVARTLKELRKINKISQEQLAAEINSHQVYISEIEQGKKLPSLLILKNIAVFFNMKLSELVRLIEENETDTKP